MAFGLDDNSSQVDDALDEVLDCVMEKCEAGAKATIAPLILFHSFDERLRSRCNAYWEDRKERWSNRMLFIPRIPDLRLLKDGVHLNDISAKKFIDHVTEASLAYFEDSRGPGRQDAMDLTESNRSDSEMDVESVLDRTLTQSFKTSRKRPAVEPIVRRQEFELMKKDVDRKFANVLFTSARQSEDIDFVMNQANLHKVIVHGLVVEGIHDKEERKERVSLLKDAAKELLEAIKTESNKGPRSSAARTLDTPEPVFIKHLNERTRGPKEERPRKQMVELVFAKADNAVQLRDAYAALNKQWKAEKEIPEKFKGIFLTPSQTQRTRVRIEVLKAVAKVINTSRRKEEGSAWVVAHLSRPVLKVTFGKESTPRTFMYADAIKWSAGKYPVAEQDLLEAYRVAGSSFGEAIENQFIVLKAGTRIGNYRDARESNKRPRTK